MNGKKSKELRKAIESATGKNVLAYKKVGLKKRNYKRNAKGSIISFTLYRDESDVVTLYKRAKKNRVPMIFKRDAFKSYEDFSVTEKG